MTRPAGPADFKKLNIACLTERHVVTIDPGHGRVQCGSVALLRRTNSTLLTITLLHHSQMVGIALHRKSRRFEAMRLLRPLLMAL